MSARVAAEIGHVSLEVHDPQRSLAFYQPFFRRLGFQEIVHERDYLGYSLGSFTLWLVRSQSGRVSRRAITGEESVVAEHLAFRVPSVAELARIQSDLERLEIYPTFRLEAHPEFRKGYVSASWIDPDQVVVELYAIETPRPARTERPRPRRAARPRRRASKPARRRRARR